jgi:hypothetical protein
MATRLRRSLEPVQPCRIVDHNFLQQRTIVVDVAVEQLDLFGVARR